MLTMPDPHARESVLTCYRCGQSLEALSLPLSRMDLCPGCGVELHVCRMCRHYAPSAPDACDEEDAVEVRNKTVANFCDYFDPNPEAFEGSERRADERARARLEALFGDHGGDDPPAGSGPGPESGTREEDETLRRAEDLFRK
jgi:hypothetical protein